MKDKEEFYGFDKEFLDENEAIFFRLGISAMEKKDYLQAISMLDASYRIKPTFEKNKALATCYFENNEPRKAYETLNDFYDEYANQMEDAMFVLSVMEDLKYFVPLHQWYATMLERFPEQNDEIIRRERASSILENDYTRSKQSEIKMVLSINKKIIESEVKMPLMIYMNVREILPLDLFIQETKDWLIDEKIDWTLRATILEDYARLGLTQTFSYLAYPSRMIEVVPAELAKSPYKTSLFQEVLAECEEITNYAPDLYEVIRDEVHVEFSCLYPLAHEFISEDEVEEYVAFLVQACLAGVDSEKARAFPKRYAELFQYIVQSENDLNNQ